MGDDERSRTESRDRPSGRGGDGSGADDSNGSASGTGDAGGSSAAAGEGGGSTSGGGTSGARRDTSGGRRGTSDAASGAGREGAGGGAAGGPGPGASGPGGRAERGWGDTLHGVQEAVGDMMGEVLDGVRDVAAGRRFPRVDVLRREGEGYRVYVDLPGVQKEHLEVTTMGGEITVAGRRLAPDAAEDADVLRSERGHGSFRRSVRLPPDALEEQVRATLEDGVLVIRVPLAEREDAHRVEID